MKALIGLLCVSLVGCVGLAVKSSQELKAEREQAYYACLAEARGPLVPVYDSSLIQPLRSANMDTVYKCKQQTKFER